MKDLSLHQAAQRLGLTRPELIKRMKAAGLLDSNTLPAAPVRDRLYLRAKERPGITPNSACSTATRRRCARPEWHGSADKLGIPRVCRRRSRTAARLADEPRPREYARQIVTLRTMRNAAALERCRNTYGNLYEPT